MTRTDVAQAEARLAAARASRQQAEGKLAIDRANFARFVGHAPQNLAQPELPPVLPLTRDEALALAATKNPNVHRRGLHRGIGALDRGGDAGAASAEPQSRQATSTARRRR